MAAHAHPTTPSGRFDREPVSGEKAEIGTTRLIADPAALGLAAFALTANRTTGHDALPVGEPH